MNQRWFRWFGTLLLPVVVFLAAISFRVGEFNLFIGTGMIAGTAVTFLIGGWGDGITIRSKGVRWYQIASVGYLFLAAWCAVLLLGVSSSEPYSDVLIIGGVMGGLSFLAVGVDVYLGGKYLVHDLSQNGHNA